MKIFLGVVLWCLLCVLAWPLAVAVLVLFPLVWLVLLPFRLVFVVVEALFALIRAILFLPARLFGCKTKA